MWRSITRTLLAATLTVSAATLAIAQYTEQELPAPDSGNGADRLGFSCDIDGNLMIVGAPYATVDGTANHGLAVVYRRDLQGDWVVEAELKPADPEAALMFAGWSVGISGDTAIVGVPESVPSAPPLQEPEGSAYVFTRTGGVWIQSAKLAPDPALFEGGGFGWDVAIDDNTIAVGAPRVYRPTVGAPLFVYFRNAGIWTEQATLFRPEEDFGSSLALEGDTLVAGMPGVFPGPNNTDAVVYTRQGSSWTTLPPQMLGRGSALSAGGHDVALSGDRILVGDIGGPYVECFNPPCDATLPGSVHSYTRNAGTWTYEARVDVSPMPGYEYLGFRVALSGNAALVGVPGLQQSRLYIISNDQWVRLQTLTPQQTYTHSPFGVSAALSGDTALLGSSYTSMLLGGSGPDQPCTAYAYHFDPMAAFTLPAMTNQTFHPDIPVTFSEPVTGLAADDFSVDGLSVSNIQGSEDEYTMDITLQTGDGTKSLFLPAGSVEDTSGTINAQSPTASILLDQTPPTSEALLADLTQAGSFVEGTYSANDAGSGIDTLTLYALPPAGTWTESTSSLVENGSITYIPAGGDGLHRIATVATDKVGNIEAAPSGNAPGDVALLWNDINNSIFTHPAAVDGVYTFPMTTPLDVILDISGDAGAVTVSRTVGDVAPAGLETTRLIDESIVITLGKPGASALVTWNAHPPILAAHTAALNTVLQYHNGDLLHQFDLTRDGDALHFGPITEGGTFYAGDRLAVIGDVWMLY